MYGWTSQLLDGENRWGFVRIQIDRFGVTRYRLTVYPPGISDVERRHLRTWRGLPIWGAALWVVMEVVLESLIGTWPALVIATGTVVVLGVRSLLRAGGRRHLVRTMTVVTMPGYTTAEMLAERDRLKVLAAMLIDGDERLNDERMSPLEHEALWWKVYEQLSPTHSRLDAPQS
jgi:uncharacterized protein DUF6611